MGPSARGGRPVRRRPLEGGSFRRVDYGGHFAALGPGFWGRVRGGCPGRSLWGGRGRALRGPFRRNPDADFGADRADDGGHDCGGHPTDRGTSGERSGHGLRRGAGGGNHPGAAGGLSPRALRHLDALQRHFGLHVGYRDSADPDAAGALDRPERSGGWSRRGGPGFSRALGRDRAVRGAARGHRPGRPFLDAANLAALVPSPPPRPRSGQRCRRSLLRRRRVAADRGDSDGITPLPIARLCGRGTDPDSFRRDGPRVARLDRHPADGHDRGQPDPQKPRFQPRADRPGRGQLRGQSLRRSSRGGRDHGHGGQHPSRCPLAGGGLFSGPLCCSLSSSFSRLFWRVFRWPFSPPSRSK